MASECDLAQMLGSVRTLCGISHPCPVPKVLQTFNLFRSCLRLNVSTCFFLLEHNRMLETSRNPHHPIVFTHESYRSLLRSLLLRSCTHCKSSAIRKPWPQSRRTTLNVTQFSHPNYRTERIHSWQHPWHLAWWPNNSSTVSRRERSSSTDVAKRMVLLPQEQELPHYVRRDKGRHEDGCEDWLLGWRVRHDGGSCRSI